MCVYIYIHIHTHVAWLWLPIYIHTRVPRSWKKTSPDPESLVCYIHQTRRPIYAVEREKTCLQALWMEW